MKAAILIAIGAAIALATPAIVPVADAEAHAWKKRHTHKHSAHRHRGSHGRRHFTQREIDTLPVRITRPPGTSHYIYDDYPAWAARAFERPQNR